MFCQQAKTLLRARRSPALQIAREMAEGSEPAGEPARASQGGRGGTGSAGRRSHHRLREPARAGDRLAGLSGVGFALRCARKALACSAEHNSRLHHTDACFDALRRWLAGSAQGLSLAGSARQERATRPTPQQVLAECTHALMQRTCQTASCML